MNNFLFNYFLKIELEFDLSTRSKIKYKQLYILFCILYCYDVF
jgi:hypothetical protein